MNDKIILGTKYGPIEVWANNAHGISAQTTDPQEGPTIFGVAHRRASLHAFDVTADGMMPAAGDRERATYTATAGKTTIGTTYHGYGVSMYRVEPFLEDASEAAKRAWRTEVLQVLADFVNTPDGQRLRAEGEVRRATRAHEITVKALVEARHAEAIARKALRAAERALGPQ